MLAIICNRAVEIRSEIGLNDVEIGLRPEIGLRNVEIGLKYKIGRF
jgi:hypothetical protein